MNLVNYITATERAVPPIQAQMYEYVTAANGVFVRGQREGLEVMLPVTQAPRVPIRGLVCVEPYVHLSCPRVPSYRLASMHEYSRWMKDACANPIEVLFYLHNDDSGIWHTVVPQQKATEMSVVSTDKPELQAQALIEVHSHHRMAPSFSSTDDADETGFRVYTVLGNIFTRPAIRVRVGLYGYRWEIPASWIFDLPPEIEDAYGKP